MRYSWENSGNCDWWSNKPASFSKLIKSLLKREKLKKGRFVYKELQLILSSSLHRSSAPFDNSANKKGIISNPSKTLDSNFLLTFHFEWCFKKNIMDIITEFQFCDQFLIFNCLSQFISCNSISTFPYFGKSNSLYFQNNLK